MWSTNILSQSPTLSMKELSVTIENYEISWLILLILFFIGYCFPKGPEWMMKWSITFVMKHQFCHVQLYNMNKIFFFQNLFYKKLSVYSLSVNFNKHFFIINTGFKNYKSCQFQNLFVLVWFLLANHKPQCEFLQQRNAMSHKINLPSESSYFPWMEDRCFCCCCWIGTIICIWWDNGPYSLLSTHRDTLTIERGAQR